MTSNAKKQTSYDYLSSECCKVLECEYRCLQVFDIRSSFRLRVLYSLANHSWAQKRHLKLAWWCYCSIWPCCFSFNFRFQLYEVASHGLQWLLECRFGCSFVSRRLVFLWKNWLNVLFKDANLVKWGLLRGLSCWLNWNRFLRRLLFFQKKVFLKNRSKSSLPYELKLKIKGRV